MNGMIVVWLIIGLFFLITELCSLGFFFFLSFFVGALVAACSVPVFPTVMIQLFIFLGGTIMAFLLFRLWIQKWGSRTHKKQETNIDALRGKRAVVVKAIGPNKPGYISLYGVLWMAHSAHYDSIDEGTWVEIIDVQGAHLIVVATKS